MSTKSDITYILIERRIDMAVDKEKNVQVLVTFPHDLLKEIENYQFANRVPNRNEAIRLLVKKGLEKEQTE